VPAQDTTQVVLDLYAAFGRGDVPAILGVLSTDVDWYFVGRPEDIPFAGRRHGHAQMVEFFTAIGQTVDVLEFGPREMLACEDKVLVLGHERVRVRATERVFESDWAHVYTIESGKIVRLREFYDTATIAAAFRAGA
jgi:ketosteroid isomerase-like protein